CNRLDCECAFKNASYWPELNSGAGTGKVGWKTSRYWSSMTTSTCAKHCQITLAVQGLKYFAQKTAV
ncbi:response regulator, partial [Vibrio parahaemolyticus V-223/04]